jgi:hypothetical protein
VDWNDFTQRLAAELIALPVDAQVMVRAPGGFPYVRAIRYPAALVAEAAGDALPSERARPDEARGRRMAELGWRAPDGRTRLNWWYDMTLPAGTAPAAPAQLAGCHQVAAMMAAALRDVHGLRLPDELEYRTGGGGGGIGWPEFAERLAAELAALADGMVLVVHRADRDAYYVQAHRDPHRLRAEAVGNDLLDEALRFPETDEKRLAEAGWGGPGPNWWVELPPGAPPTEFRRLAGMMVTALRHVQGAGEPSDLRYEAFRGDIGIELTDFGIELADPGAVSERRAARPAPGPPGIRAAGPPGRAPEDLHTADLETGELDTGELEAENLEAGLIAAKRAGDHDAYLALLGDAGLIVPSSGTSRGVEFATTRLADGTYVLTFTSPAAMRRVLGDQARRFRHVTLDRLAVEWPDPGWRLSIDLGLPTEAYFDATVITAVRRAAAGPESPPVPGPAVEPDARTAPAADAGEAAAGEAAEAAAAGEPDGAATMPPAIMQKVVPHPLVVHYLDGGYDRVAGYVHRVRDVADLTTPERLVHGLGLTYDGSPFSPDDEAIHVIRWPAHKPELFKTPLGGVDEPSMRSVQGGWVVERPPFLGTGFAPGDGPPVPEFKIATQRLPHGAEMHQITHAGEVTLVAVFDADLGRWTAAGR